MITQKVKLAVDEGDISDELYDMLLEAFIAKAKALGHVVDDRHVVTNWVLSAEIEEF